MGLLNLIATAKSRLFDFTPGARILSQEIDDEFNQSVSASNDVVTDLTSINTSLEDLAGTGRSTENLKGNKDLIDGIRADLTTEEGALTTHKGSADHDGRYYTESESDTMDGANVKKTGAQLIGGVKTYTDRQLIPEPQIDANPSTKKYVDDENNKDMHLTGNQTIADVKTYTSSPVVPTPLTAYQASTKKYVDDIEDVLQGQIDTNDTDIAGLDSGKAEKSNVIEKDSTVTFTPTASTHPTNKQYVDDAIVGIAVGTFPEDSITDVFLSDNAGQIKDRVDQIENGQRSAIQTSQKPVDTFPTGTLDGKVLAVIGGQSIAGGIDNNNFVTTTGWVPTYGSVAVADNILSLTCDGTGHHPKVEKLTTLGNGVNNFCDVRFRVTNPDCDEIAVSFIGSTSGEVYNVLRQFNPVENQWYHLNDLMDLSVLVGDISIKVRAQYLTDLIANGTVLQVDGVHKIHAINLDIYGLESKTASEMADMTLQMAENTDLQHSTPDVETVTKNLIDIQSPNVYTVATILTEGTDAYKDAILFYDIFPMQYAGTNIYGIDAYVPSFTKNGGNSYTYTSIDKFRSIGFKIKTNANTVYTSKFISTTGTVYATAFCFYDNKGNLLSFSTSGVFSRIITTPSNCTYVIVIFSMDYAGEKIIMYPQLELGDTATGYKSFNHNLWQPGKVLRSLPNLVRDSLRNATLDGGVYKPLKGYEHEQNVSDEISITNTDYDSHDNTTYTNVDVTKTILTILDLVGTSAIDKQTHLIDKNGTVMVEVASADIDLTTSNGKYYVHTDKSIWYITTANLYADIAAARTGLGTTKVFNELATPVITPLTLDEIWSFASGTIYQNQTVMAELAINTAINQGAVIEGNTEMLESLDDKIKHIEGGTATGSATVTFDTAFAIAPAVFPSDVASITTTGFTMNASGGDWIATEK